MDYFISLFKSSIEDFRRSKMRTFLTSLGILIGVASVVLLVALGLGLKKYIEQQFQSLGANLIYVMPGNFVQNGQFTASGPPAGGTFDDKDVTDLKKVRNTTTVLPVFVKVVKDQALGETYLSQLMASNADIFDALNFESDAGRLFTKNDFEKASKVAVIGPEVAKKLFGDLGSAIGKIIKLNDQAFRVIGVTKSKGGGGLGSSLDSRTIIPYTAALTFNPSKKFFAVYLQAIDKGSIPTVIEEAKKTLLKRYKADDFSVIEQTEFVSAINSIFGIINTVLVAIAAISLIVGGIGIMNIMYVSVAERTHEVGIRRAIGATKRDILFQFLTEAIILSLIGGSLGLTLASFAVLLLQTVFPAYIDPGSVALAIGVSSAIGLVFGVLPARKAADLSPIEAIRYE